MQALKPIKKAIILFTAVTVIEQLLKKKDTSDMLISLYGFEKAKELNKAYLREKAKYNLEK